MPVRHQMLRHIDCAWEIRGNRPVFGFFIVEGDDHEELPMEWTGFVHTTIHPDALAHSLPHRSVRERDQIAEAFLGATTWQRVCKELGIDWSTIPDEVSK